MRAALGVVLACVVLSTLLNDAQAFSASLATPQAAADTILRALLASGTSASEATLAKYTFPKPARYAIYPRVLFDWKKMADEQYTSGAIRVYRRFIQATTQSTAGTRLTEQKVMVLYIDRRVGHWRLFTFTDREDWDFILGLIKGTETHYEKPSDFTRGEWYLTVGRPAEALGYLRRASSERALQPRDRGILRDYLEAIYGMR